MYCRICPVYPLVEAIVAAERGDYNHPLLNEADSRFEELSERCTACHLKARKNDTHLGPDRDGGRLHGEIAFKESIFAPGFEQREYTTDPDYIAARQRDTSTGSTASLSPEAEDELRKAVAVIVEKVEIADAAALLAVLKREPLAKARGDCDLRSYAVRARRVLGVVEEAKRIIKSDRETRRAAAKLVSAIGSMLTPCDAPVVLGMLQRKSLAEIARAAGLRNRATAHARARSMLKRLPQLKPLHSTAMK